MKLLSSTKKTEKSLKPLDFVDSMGYIQRGFRHTSSAIQQHPGLTILLIVLQVVVLGAIIYSGVTYQLKILSDAQNIIIPLEQANYDPQQVEEGRPFLQDTQKIYQSYRSLLRNLIYAAIIFTLFFLVGNGMLWSLSHRLLGKYSWQHALKQGVKYLLIVLLLYVPIAIASYFYLRSIVVQQLATDNFSAALKIIIYVVLAAYYGVLAAAALLPATWKELPGLWLQVGIKKMYKTLPVLLINSIILAGLLYLMYLGMQPGQSFFLLIFSSLLVIVGIVLTRLFWISCLQEIAHETSAA